MSLNVLRLVQFRVKSIPRSYCRREETVHKIIVINPKEILFAFLEVYFVVVLGRISLTYLGDVHFNIL